MDHLNRLRTFRQDLYDQVLTKRRDAQFQLLDALLLSPPVHSFPELSLSPAFERSWHSLYKAVEDGDRDEDALSDLLARYLPSTLVMVFALDESAWPRADAVTLPDRGFVHSATAAVDGASIVIGHSYSVLAYVAEAKSSWTLPVSIRRVDSTRDAVTVGLEQIRALCRRCRDKPGLKVIVADGRYGNHRFLGGVPEQAASGGLALLARLRSDRVLYQAPGPYTGRGRPRTHGDVFRFKDPATWPDPQEDVRFSDPDFGTVELQLWEGLHAREASQTVFSLVRASVHLERAQPPKPVWFAWVGPALAVEEIWRYYDERATLEAGFRFRKQYLAWTRPRVQTIEASLRWTDLVTLAQWTLWLSRSVVRDRPQPWQQRQVRLTPERVKQSLGALFCQIGSPAHAPKTRGKSPGWPVGRRRSPRDRCPVVRKSAPKGARARKKART